MKQYCKTCALLGQPGDICQITGRQINPEADYCSNHRRTLEVCDMCGRQTLETGSLTQVGDEVKLACIPCTERMNTCATCEHRGPCIFNDKTVHPELPPVVVKTMQRGPATMQAQVKNPDREATVCPLCECFVEGWGCGREAHTCDRYKDGWKK